MIEDLIISEYGLQEMRESIHLGRLQRLRRCSFITSGEVCIGLRSLENLRKHIENMFLSHYIGLGLEEFNLIIKGFSQPVDSDVLVGIRG